MSDTSYAVWGKWHEVAGTKATMSTNGTWVAWSASNVPVNEGDTTSFVARACALGETQP